MILTCPLPAKNRYGSKINKDGTVKTDTSLHHQGYAIKRIARDLGISKTTIKNISEVSI
ncbi:MAG: hypothetical protein IPF93_01960 [Saprospiraceae bacterium]|nr:hypothetical protein [Saprospiraceae bacterium]